MPAHHRHHTPWTEQDCSLPSGPHIPAESLRLSLCWCYFFSPFSSPTYSLDIIGCRYSFSTAIRNINSFCARGNSSFRPKTPLFRLKNGHFRKSHHKEKHWNPLVSGDTEENRLKFDRKKQRSNVLRKKQSNCKFLPLSPLTLYSTQLTWQSHLTTLTTVET